MLVQILIDNPKSWIIPYAKDLKLNILKNFNFDVSLIHNQKKVVKGDILVMLSCEKIFKKLNLNKHNLVVHESKLPNGKGWSPLTWQIIEGVNEITVTLFEADEKIDSGNIYASKSIELSGKELIDELRHLQAINTIELILEFIKNYPNNKSYKQDGNSTYYRKRTSDDSKIDIEKTIKEQFNLLRIVDNERYPAFFEYKGQRYYLKIFKNE